MPPEYISLEGLDKKDIEIMKAVKEERQTLDNLQSEENKKWNPLGNIMDILIFVGVICLAVFSVLALLGFAYAIFIANFPIQDLWIILGLAVLLLLIGCMVMFLMIMQAGSWFKFGRSLKQKKGDGIIKFTDSGRILFDVEKRAKLMYFNPKDKLSRFFTTKKGYIEPATGAVFRTVRENAPTDFDVNEEYKIDLEEMSPLMNNRLEQQWDAGINWNKTNKDLLLMLVLIGLIASVGSALLAGGNLYQTSDKVDKLTKTVDSINNNVNNVAKKLDMIPNSTNPNGNGAIVEGG